MCTDAEIHGVFTNQNRTAPATWVVAMIVRTGKTGLDFVTHLAGSLSFAGIFIQPASFHKFNPPNIMATLIKMALGRKFPIFNE